MADKDINDVNARFAQLLTPIRDLAENWNIDIAAYLEDYLSDLEKITITFDGGKTTMNFAQAAMLIQGSACVYSKKVEYLYSFVLQMLELLHSKKKLQKQLVKKNENDDLLPVPEEEEEEEFLPLDDIEEGKNIDLKEDAHQQSSIKFLPRVSVKLLPTKERSINDDFIYTKDGELVGKTNDFGMTLSTFDSSGLLLLPGCCAGESSTVIETRQTHALETEILAQNRNEESICDDVCEPMPVLTYDETSSNPESIIENIEEPESIIENIEEPEVRMKMQRQATPKLIHENVNDCEKEAAKEMDTDILVPLDQYKQNAKKEKPFRKSIVYKIFLDVNIPKNDGDFESRDHAILKLEPIHIYCSEYFSNKNKFPKNRMKIPISSDFEAHYWKEHKLRYKIRTKRKQTVKSESSDDEDSEDDNDHMPADIPDDHETTACLDDLQVPVFEENENMQRDEDNAESFLLTSYEKLVKDYVDNYLSSARNFQESNELARKVNEWEEKISPLLEITEKRPAFDIHEYGTKVLNSFVDNYRKQTLPFSEIVAGKNASEITRYFAATLQLANSYNIAISTEGKTESGSDNVLITLLSHKRHHEQLQEYVAPSIEHQQVK